MKVIEKRLVLKTHPFEVEELRLEVRGRESSHSWHRLVAPDWVNVLPVTVDRQALLIRQPRAGVLKTLLECPGGVMDPGEKDPTLAAARELEEETGYHSQRLLALGAMHPNPALLSNRMHFFLALGCTPAADRRRFPDPDEAIEVVPVPVGDLDDLVRTGRIDHALCALCIMLAQKYL
jgi:8-oxo-dGTP pyrophosphatase MutT (NUDIX family)